MSEWSDTQVQFFIINIIYALAGVFFVGSGIFMAVSYKKLLSSNIKREDDMLFEIMQKLDYILGGRRHKEFIEDKNRLANSALGSGVVGIAVGTIMLISVVYGMLELFLN